MGKRKEYAVLIDLAEYHPTQNDTCIATTPTLKLVDLWVEGDLTPRCKSLVVLRRTNRVVPDLDEATGTVFYWEIVTNEQT